MYEIWPVMSMLSVSECRKAKLSFELLILQALLLLFHVVVICVLQGGTPKL